MTSFASVEVPSGEVSGGLLPAHTARVVRDQGSEPTQRPSHASVPTASRAELQARWSFELASQSRPESDRDGVVLPDVQATGETHHGIEAEPRLTVSTANESSSQALGSLETLLRGIRSRSSGTDSKTVEPSRSEPSDGPAQGNTSLRSGAKVQHKAAKATESNPARDLAAIAGGRLPALSPSSLEQGSFKEIRPDDLIHSAGFSPLGLPESQGAQSQLPVQFLVPPRRPSQIPSNQVSGIGRTPSAELSQPARLTQFDASPFSSVSSVSEAVALPGNVLREPLSSALPAPAEASLANGTAVPKLAFFAGSDLGLKEMVKPNSARLDRVLPNRAQPYGPQGQTESGAVVIRSLSALGLPAGTSAKPTEVLTAHLSQSARSTESAGSTGPTASTGLTALAGSTALTAPFGTASEERLAEALPGEEQKSFGSNEMFLDGPTVNRLESSVPLGKSPASRQPVGTGDARPVESLQEQSSARASGLQAAEIPASARQGEASAADSSGVDGVGEILVAAGRYSAAPLSQSTTITEWASAGYASIARPPMDSDTNWEGVPPAGMRGTAITAEGRARGEAASAATGAVTTGKSERTGATSFAEDRSAVPQRQPAATQPGLSGCVTMPTSKTERSPKVAQAATGEERVIGIGVSRLRADTSALAVADANDLQPRFVAQRDPGRMADSLALSAEAGLRGQTVLGASGLVPERSLHGLQDGPQVRAKTVGALAGAGVAGAPTAGGMSMGIDTLFASRLATVAVEAIAGHGSPAATGASPATESSRNPFQAIDSVDVRDGSNASSLSVSSSAAFGRSVGSGRSLDVGYQDPALGYIELHAHLGGSGIHASLVAESTTSGATLEGHLGSLAGWMQQRHTPVESLTVLAHRAEGAWREESRTGGSSDQSASHTGGGTGQSQSDFSQDGGSERRAAVVLGVDLATPGKGAPASLESISSGESLSRQPLFADRPGARISLIA